MNTKKILIPIIIAILFTSGIAQNGQWGRLGFKQYRGGSLTAPILLADGTVGAPSMSFSSGTDNGLYWIGDDQWGSSAGGVNAQWISEGNGEVATIFGANLVANVTGVTSDGSTIITKSGIESGVSVGDAVIIYAGSEETDFGTYIVKATASGSVILDRVVSASHSDLEINILADGLIIENSSSSGFTRLILKSGDATTVPPTLAFGDDLGIRGSLQNEMHFMLSGIDQFKMVTSGGIVFSGRHTNAGGIVQEATSSTNPTLVPDHTNLDVGLGATPGSDILHAIAGGVEIVGFVEGAADYVEHKVGTVYTPSIDQSVTADGTIVIDNTIVRVVGSPGAVALTSDPAIEDGITDGQIIIIQGTSANTVTINDAVNTALAGDASVVLAQGDIIQLIWDAGDSVWYEVSRSDN